MAKTKASATKAGKVTKKPAKAPPRATPKAIAKPAPKATLAKKKAAAKATPPAAPRKKPATRGKGPAPIDSLGAADVLARIVLFARSEEDLGDEVPRLVDRLRETADASLIPAMFGALDDYDPHGVLWSVFYLVEAFDDAYLAGLLEALPGLTEHAPGWAETAVLRIVNTRGEPEDCTGTFVALAKRSRPAARRRTAATLLRMAKSADGLHTSQRKILGDLARGITDA